MTPIFNPNWINHVDDVLKVWTPLIGVGTFIFGLWKTTKKSVSSWANKLLNNHMDHLQASLDRIDSAQKQQIEHLSVQTEQLNRQTVFLGQIAEDLRPRFEPPARKSRRIKN